MGYNQCLLLILLLKLFHIWFVVTPFSCPLYPFDIFPSFCVLLYFLMSQDVSCSSYIFLAPRLKSIICPRSHVSFYWRIVSRIYMYIYLYAPIYCFMWNDLSQSKWMKWFFDCLWLNIGLSIWLNGLSIAKITFDKVLIEFAEVTSLRKQIDWNSAWIVHVELHYASV